MRKQEREYVIHKSLNKKKQFQISWGGNHGKIDFPKLDFTQYIKFSTLFPVNTELREIKREN